MTVLGDWRQSNLVAGVQNANGTFGDTNDVAIPGSRDDLFSKIASITIHGVVSGGPSAGSHYGFVAQEIGALKIGTLAYRCMPGGRTTFCKCPPSRTT